MLRRHHTFVKSLKTVFQKAGQDITPSLFLVVLPR